MCGWWWKNKVPRRPHPYPGMHHGVHHGVHHDAHHGAGGCVLVFSFRLEQERSQSANRSNIVLADEHLFGELCQICGKSARKNYSKVDFSQMERVLKHEQRSTKRTADQHTNSNTNLDNWKYFEFFDRTGHVKTVQKSLILPKNVSTRSFTPSVLRSGESFARDERDVCLCVPVCVRLCVCGTVLYVCVV